MARTEMGRADNKSEERGRPPLRGRRMTACEPRPSSMRTWARQYPRLYGGLRLLWRALSPFALPNPLPLAPAYARCVREFLAYRRMPGGDGARWCDWYPALRDRTTVTPV